MAKRELYDMTVDMGGLKQETRLVEYPSNAHNKQPPAAEKEPIIPVVSGRVRRKTRKSGVLAETGKSVWDYVLNQVLLPAFRETAYEVIQGGSYRAIFGEGAARSPRGGMTGYNRYARPAGGVTTQPSNIYQRRVVSPQARESHIFDEIILESRDEADAVLSGMLEMVKVYHQVSVGDMLTLANVEAVFTDHQWGWTDREAVNLRIVPTQGGFLLRTPPTVPLAT